MPYIKTQVGLNWHYKNKSKNDTILFIHGWSFDASVWFKQADSLHNHNVITVDLPGHGNSEYKKDSDTIEELKFIADKLDLDNISIIGHSLGGFLAMKLALRYPGLVKKLVLVGTPAKFVKSDDYSFGLEDSEVSKLRWFLSNNYPNVLLVFYRWLFTKEERSQKDFREIWSALSKRKAWPKKDAMDDLLFVIEKDDLRERINEINIPTLIICGTKDPICPVESIDYISRQKKDCRVELFKDCGHLPFLTQPQRFNKLVEEFLG